MGGWMEVKAILRFAHSNQKFVTSFDRIVTYSKQYFYAIFFNDHDCDRANGEII
jgi:hypothetical protein